MKGEILWKAMGEIAEDLVIWAENPPRQNKRKNFAVILAAAIIMLLSVGTVAAMRFNISFADLFGFAEAEIIEVDKQIIEENTPVEVVPETEEKTGSEFTVISALADERIMYLLWQFDYYDGEIPEGAQIMPWLSFGESSVDTKIGYYGGMVDENRDEDTLVGYMIAEWNGEMQAESGSISFSEITAPGEQGSKIYETDILSAIEQSEYIEGEYEIYNYSGKWPYKYYAEYQWLDIPAYEDTYIDLAVYEDGKLILVTRTPWGDGVERRGTFELINKKTGKALELISRHGFKDKNRFDFFSVLYEVDYEDIENLCFRRKGEIVQKNWLSGDWKIDFKAEPKMEDIILETADENIEIRCSKISMGISGKLPEMEYMQIFLADGTEISCVSATPERVIFPKPINPKEIASIIYNGAELLA
ncbi:MAG: hypothetical protein IKD39_05075 [Oscillospiraceae bacterium]|nr:hypothetical protein [Oscillospiraceae bacterium]MBR3963217.1 hypothetical protein [Oscillospiraceae bacterium]